MSRRRNFWAVAAMVAAAAGLAAGLWQLMAGRFRVGNIHPDYSTYLAGPTGTRAVFEAFERLGRLRVERNILPLTRFDGRDGTTLVLAGAGAAVFGEDTAENFERLEGMMEAGLRVVVTLNARAVPMPLGARTAPVANPWEDDALGPIRRGLPGGTSGGDDEVRVSAGERWGFRFAVAENPDKAPAAGYEVVAVGEGPDRPPRWHSVWRWADLSPAWVPLAEVGGQPVLVRRAFGRGSLTLASDTVFLSNEALALAPQPGFLAWLLGGAPRLVFDETLHGTMGTPGVMTLMRRYRLLGFFVGAAVLLGLFVWRAGTSLVPMHPSVLDAPDQPVKGADGRSGLANLLRQTLPPRQLLRACFLEWAKSPFVRRGVNADAVAAVRDRVLAAENDRQANPAAVHDEIVQRLAAARRGG